MTEHTPLVAHLKKFALNWLQVKIGFTPMLLVLLPITLGGAIFFYAFCCLTAYEWLALSFGPVAAALWMAAFFALIGVVGLVAALLIRRHVQEAAITAQQVQRAAFLASPALLETTLAAGRKFGWHRTIPFGLLGVLGWQIISAIAARQRIQERGT